MLVFETLIWTIRECTCCMISVGSMGWVEAAGWKQLMLQAKIQSRQLRAQMPTAPLHTAQNVILVFYTAVSFTCLCNIQSAVSFVTNKLCTQNYHVAA